MRKQRVLDFLGRRDAAAHEWMAQRRCHLGGEGRQLQRIIGLGGEGIEDQVAAQQRCRSECFTASHGGSA